MFGWGRKGVMMQAVRAGVVFIAIAASPGWAAPPVAPAPAAPTSAPMSLPALKQLDPGLWQLDIDGRAPKLVCVAEPTSLVQVEHDQPNCSRFVIANEPKSATVHYSCQRAGWGRTTVRVETPESASIHTQGISRNAPFDYSVQARRVGACDGSGAAKRR